jgi:hypothetical protein
VRVLFQTGLIARGYRFSDQFERLRIIVQKQSHYFAQQFRVITHAAERDGFIQFVELLF